MVLIVTLMSSESRLTRVWSRLEKKQIHSLNKGGGGYLQGIKSLTELINLHVKLSHTPVNVRLNPEVQVRWRVTKLCWGLTSRDWKICWWLFSLCYSESWFAFRRVGWAKSTSLGITWIFGCVLLFWVKIGWLDSFATCHADMQWMIDRYSECSKVRHGQSLQGVSALNNDPEDVDGQLVIG